MTQLSRNALYSKIAGASTITTLLGGTAIYDSVAPSSASYPFIVIHQQSGVPVYTHKVGAAAIENEVWTIRAVDKSTSSARAEAIAKQLDVLLTDGNLSIAGYTQMYLKRESDVPTTVETDGGQEYRSAGAMFRLMYQP